ncbi:MAG: diguanylate cyclase [Clostridia bacterium]
MGKRILFFGCVIFLLVLHSFVFILGSDVLRTLSPLLSIVTIAIAGITFGLKAGIPLGLFAGIAGFLLHPPGMDPIALSVLLVPILSGFVFGMPGDRILRKQEESDRLFKEKEALLSRQARTLSEYNTLAERLTLEPAYRKKGPPPPYADPNIERILGAFLEQPSPDKAKGLRTGKELSEKCFDILTHAIPEAVALADLSGRIVAVNSTLMAFFGYFPGSLPQPENILDLLVEEDREKAEKNIGNLLLQGLKSTDLYRVKPCGGITITGFGQDTLRLTSAGNPQSILATLVQGDSSHPMFPSLDQMAGKDIWMVSGTGKTLFISPSLSHLLGYSTGDIARHQIQYFLDEANTGAFRKIAEQDAVTAGSKHPLELITKSGSRVYAYLTVFPLQGPEELSLGLLLFLENITDRSLVEQTLQHRLSIEKLITDISTAFISVRPESLAGELVNGLERIGNFLEARESHIQIFASTRTGEGFRHSILKKDGSASRESNEDTFAIPILTGTETVGDFRFVQESSKRAWLEEDINLLRMAGEIFVNALARKQALDQLKISEEKMRITLHSIGDAVIATDMEERIVMVNTEALRMLDCEYGEVIGQPFHEIFTLVKGRIKPSEETSEPEEDDGPSLMVFDRDTPVLRSRKGVERFISLSSSPIQDDRGVDYGSIYVFSDITEKKKREEEIIYLTFHDSLTGLHSRAFFEVELQRLDTRRQYPLTLIIGDCNGLKITNDIFGHQEGDNLLKRIAEIFRSVTRKEDICARWGGDEFAIILPRTPENTAMEIRARILEACRLSDPFPIQPSIALGSASKTDESQSLADVLKEAEDRMYRHKLLEDKSNRSSIIASLEKTLVEKSHETEEHAKRMQDFSEKIAVAIGLSESESDDLRLLSVLHDMGKIGIPDVILEKPSRLSDDEWDIMKTHSEKGFSIAETSKELSNIATYILHHHERWDGSGYPHGLSGQDIPKLSRIISIVDAYDVITHQRPYKNALSHEEAIEEIKRCAGTQFDPELVDVFLEIMESYKRESSPLIQNAPPPA